MKRLLVIRWGALGDLMHAAASVQAAKQAYPQLEVHWLTSSAYQSLVRNLPGVDEVWTWEKRQGLWALFRLAVQFRQWGVDAVINLHPSLKSLLFTALVRPRFSAVYQKQKLRSKGLAQRSLSRRHAASDFYQPFQRLLDLPLDLSHRPHWLPLASANLASVPQKPSGMRWLGVIPGVGAKRSNRAWPLESYQQVVTNLLGQYPDLDVVLIGGPAERALSEELMTALGPLATRVENTCGRFDILGTAALLAQCDVVVGGDTGPMHLAAATGVPLVGLYGPTALTRTGPLALGAAHLLEPPQSLSCWPCEAAECPLTGADYLACMRQLTPDVVQAAILALLAPH